MAAKFLRKFLGLNKVSRELDENSSSDDDLATETAQDDLPVCATGKARQPDTPTTAQPEVPGNHVSLPAAQRPPAYYYNPPAVQDPPGKW